MWRMGLEQLVSSSLATLGGFPDCSSICTRQTIQPISSDKAAEALSQLGFLSQLLAVQLLYLIGFVWH